MKTKKSKVDTGKALDVGLVVIESSGTKSKVQDESNRSGNDIDTDDAYIRPIYNKEPMVEIQEKVFAIAALKNELRKSKGYSVDAKFAKPSILGKPFLQPLRNHSVVRQPNAFKSKILKPRFAAQADEILFLSKLVTQHYFPKGRESAFAELHHMITSSSSRNSSKNMPRFSSNDMIFTGHRFSPNKTFAVYEKKSPRYDLKWKPMGKILKTVGFRWVPTGKIFASCTSKTDSEPTHGSNVDISNIHECKQSLNLSASTSINVKKEQSFDLSAGTSYNVNKDNLRVWLMKS
ncbi:hypothetical protein Tco_1172914 [Tanacetum coccineum]